MSLKHNRAHRVALLVTLAFNTLLAGVACDSTVSAPERQGAPAYSAASIEIEGPIDLGTLGGNSSAAHDVNLRGQIVGESRTADGQTRAFLWERGVMTELENLGGPIASAHAINDRGQIVGVALDQDNTYQAVIWDHHGISVLPTGGPCGELRLVACGWALDVNVRGEVVGFGFNERLLTQPLVWSKGVARDLAAAEGVAEAINLRGQVVGWSFTGHEQHATLWDGDEVVDLGTLGGPNSVAFGINASGQIVGSTYVDGATSAAFLWESGVMTALVTSFPFAAGAVDINRQGQVVGYANGQPFFWDSGQIRFMSALSGGRFSNATAINDHGEIVGTSEGADGQLHAVLWRVRAKGSTGM